MKNLDARTKEVLTAQAREEGKDYRERPTHVRRRVEKTSNRTFRKGLPRSLYHRRYLTKLSSPVKERLEIAHEDIANFDQWAASMQVNSDSETDEESMDL